MAASNSFYTSSPTVFMPPNNADQYFASSHYVDQNGHAVPSTGITPNGFATNSSFVNTPLASTPGSLAGRKRSRGDIHELDDDSQRFAVGESAVQDDDARMMTDEVEQEQFEPKHVKRPSITSRKSQRVESAAAGSDDLAQLVLPPSIREATAEPLIDEATRVLGISWTRMDSSEARAISQAAYSKWIQNHYSALQDVTVWFEYTNDSMPAYLVKAYNSHTNQVEYYIFSNDLTEARLVTREPSDLVSRLKMMPALHLAAPGGHIKADAEPTVVAGTMNGSATGHADITADTIPSRASYEEEEIHYRKPNGICAAHAMEMD